MIRAPYYGLRVLALDRKRIYALGVKVDSRGESSARARSERKRERWRCTQTCGVGASLAPGSELLDAAGLLIVCSQSLRSGWSHGCTECGAGAGRCCGQLVGGWHWKDTRVVGSGHVDDTRDTEALGANPTTGGMIGRAQQAAGCSRSRHQRRAAKSATLRRHIAGEANSCMSGISHRRAYCTFGKCKLVKF